MESRLSKRRNSNIFRLCGWKLKNVFMKDKVGKTILKTIHGFNFFHKIKNARRLPQNSYKKKIRV